MRKIRISALVVAFSVATFYLTPVHRVMASGVQALASVLAGGTGRTSLTANTVLVGEGTAPVNQVGPGTAGQCLESNGAGVDPSFGTCATGAGSVYSQTSDITVGNTVTETSVITGATGSGSPTLSAGFFTAGKTIRVVVWGYHSAAAAPTIEWKMKLGAVTVLDTTAIATNNSTNQEILAQGYITCRTTGAMGTFFSQGRYEELTHLDSQMVNTATATVDTTASQLVDVTVQWGTAAVGNTVTVTNVSIEVVGGGGGGGGLTCAGGVGLAPMGCLQEEHTAVNSAELDFTTCFSSTFDTYRFYFLNLVPATDQQNIIMEVSTNGGVSYDTGANYTGLTFFQYTGGTGVDGNTTNSIPVQGGVSSTAANGGASGYIDISNPLSATMNKWFWGISMAHQSASSIGVVRREMGARYNSITAVNAFRVRAATGNLTSGTGRCYGITK
jgi:hypothetical protein